MNKLFPVQSPPTHRVSGSMQPRVARSVKGVQPSFGFDVATLIVWCQANPSNPFCRQMMASPEFPR